MEREDVAQNETESISKNIRIVPKFFYDNFKKQLKVEFKIGEKQLYKINKLKPWNFVVSDDCILCQNAVK